MLIKMFYFIHFIWMRFYQRMVKNDDYHKNKSQVKNTVFKKVSKTQTFLFESSPSNQTDFNSCFKHLSYTKRFKITHFNPLGKWLKHRMGNENGNTKKILKEALLIICHFSKHTNHHSISKFSYYFTYAMILILI